MKNCKSSFYIWKIENGIVYLVDNNIGMTITNDAENVVSFIDSTYPSYRVVYRDTDNEWWELKHYNGIFTGFTPFSN